MSYKNALFHKQNQASLLIFSAEEISSGSSVFLTKKIKREPKLIKNISSCIPDNKDFDTLLNSYESILEQKVFLKMQAYEDAKDVQCQGNILLLLCNNILMDEERNT